MNDIFLNMVPKVSVIIPIYGVEQYIRMCATSLFDQTLEDVEFIFVNDCTTDRSMEILADVIELKRERLKKMRCTVRIEKMERNSGLAAVRKYGISLASGQYIIHCDSDDWIEPNIYKILYERAINDNADIVFCDYYIANESRKKLFSKNIKQLNREYILRRLLTESALNPVWTALVRKPLYDSIIYPIGSQAEDNTFMIQLCFFSNSYSYVSTPLYYYRTNPISISHSIEIESLIKRYQQLKDNRDIIVHFFEREHISDQYKKEMQAFLFRAKKILDSRLSDSRCRTLWMNTYPESAKTIIINPYIPLRDKVDYYMKRLFG